MKSRSINPLVANKLKCRSLSKLPEQPLAYSKKVEIPFSEHYPFHIISRLDSLKVPQLCYNLDKVFREDKRPHFTRDPKTLVFNFDERLFDISRSRDFDSSKLATFIKPSQDLALKSLAVANNCKYYASTSSITHILHALQMSFGNLTLNTNRFSPILRNHSSKFAASTFKVGAINLIYDPIKNIYGLDKYEDSTSTVLSEIGHKLERFLTCSPEVFEKYLNGESQIDASTSDKLSYHYSKILDFLLRAQLDCLNPDLPKRTFDLKTRGVAAIRMTLDVNYAENYEILGRKGYFESFEREDYDLLRSMLLKYALQSRIGNMDGVLVAYHNTYKIFGFQYFSQSKMDQWIYGNSARAQVCFDLSIKILNLLLDEVVKMFPKQTLKLYYVPNAMWKKPFKLVVVPEDERESRVFHVFFNQKKDNRFINEPVSSWNNFEQMSMNITIKELPKTQEITEDIIGGHKKFTNAEMIYPSKYFRKSYASFLERENRNSSNTSSKI